MFELTTTTIKETGLVCSAGFYRRMRAPEFAHGCGAYLPFFKVVRVETQAGAALFVILVPSGNHV